MLGEHPLIAAETLDVGSTVDEILADLNGADRLDSRSSEQPPATPAQPREAAQPEVPAELVDLIGGPGGIRTPDQGIMSPLLYR